MITTAAVDRAAGLATSCSPPDPSECARHLDGHPDYKVLRRLRPEPAFVGALPPDARLGLMLDVETTGLDAASDEVIELAMVPFAYSLGGRILGTLPAFRALSEPSAALPQDVARLTGLSDADLAGRRIDDEAVAAFVAPAALVVAHHARFDRPFVERRWGCFSRKPWACTLDQIDWRADGAEGTKLSYLLSRIGSFHDGHRAVDDCHAAIALLASQLRSGASALSVLLTAARATTWRIEARGAPFAGKDVLKRRGYRWSTARSADDVTRRRQVTIFEVARRGGFSIESVLTAAIRAGFVPEQPLSAKIGLDLRDGEWILAALAASVDRPEAKRLLGVGDWQMKDLAKTGLLVSVASNRFHRDDIAALLDRLIGSVEVWPRIPEGYDDILGLAKRRRVGLVGIIDAVTKGELTVSARLEGVVGFPAVVLRIADVEALPISPGRRAERSDAVSWPNGRPSAKGTRRPG